LPARSRLAVAAGRTAGIASRRLGRGAGVSIGGTVATRLAPGLLRELATGRRIVLVSGTNGKTTTTGLIARGWANSGPVVTNFTGANLSCGLVATLMSDPS